MIAWQAAGTGSRDWLLEAQRTAAANPTPRLYRMAEADYGRAQHGQHRVRSRADSKRRHFSVAVAWHLTHMSCPSCLPRPHMSGQWRPLPAASCRGQLASSYATTNAHLAHGRGAACSPQDPGPGPAHDEGRRRASAPPANQAFGQTRLKSRCLGSEDALVSALCFRIA